MKLKNKLIQLMKEKNRNSDTLERNIQIVLTYLGLGSQNFPTLQTVADEFGLNSRERVRQLINQTFKNKVKVSDVEISVEISKYIQNKQEHELDHLRHDLMEQVYIDENTNIPGVINLLHVLDLCTEYDLYDEELSSVTKSNYEKASIILLMHSDKKSKINEVYKKIKTFPGMHGLCNLYEVFEKKNISLQYFPLIKHLIINSKSSWVIEVDEANFWYMFENRDNVIINTLEKTVNVSNHIPITLLSEILHQCITKRTLPLDIPEKSIIHQYICNSKFIIINNEYATLKTNPSELLDIEQDILSFYKKEKKTTMLYPEIRMFLQNKYTKPYYDKALFHSPFIYVDKSNGRGNYQFKLVNSFQYETHNDISEYEYYKQKLKELHGQTDTTRSSKARNEQYILRNWLFKNKSVESCAICGKKFSVNALVAAHKKKRSNCSEGERTDPHIVMPLCLFGCDYLYENDFIEIKSGYVVTHTNENLQISEKEYLISLRGRQVNIKWLQGNPAYFRKNDNFDNVSITSPV